MAPQDTFIDEDEDCCPLCVEEFDLSDQNFRPCPCGYQICQFCFNNINSNINGLCPACRRPYDEKTIEWKVVTQEEIQQFKANVQKKAKKNQEQRQKEAQKREVESLNRKHLSGLRVVQKNLVYVVGLSPSLPEAEMLQTLRGEKYFGQYGKIIKVVVSKNQKHDIGPSGAQSVGIYVTFEKNEDAARCIVAVNGSQNGDRVLRAQLGTTKYCSAYLRNETCTNKSCMFLHEPGDNDDSYSRQDLSSINSINTQRPLAAASSASSSRQVAQAARIQAPIQQTQPVAAATQPMARDSSKDGSESGDGSALPASAGWATKGLPQRSRRGSHATSGAASSPAISQAVAAVVESVEEPEESIQDRLSKASNDVPPTPETTLPTKSSEPRHRLILIDLLKAINDDSVSYSRSSTSQDGESAYPPLFDDRGGEKRRAMRERPEDTPLHLDQDSDGDGEISSVPEPQEEEAPESGSLQLGGEPEDRDNSRENSLPQQFQRRPSSQLPIHRGANGGPFGPSLSQNMSQNLGNLSSINGRTLTPHQLALMKNVGQSQSGFLDQYPPGMGGQLGQASGFPPQGHNRQGSRYNFGNDGSSTSAPIKPSANSKLMAQQSSMMPPGNHSQQGQFYASSGMPGPPPGLKSSGTPPIGMFGQGHSSFSGSIYGTKENNNNDLLLQEMLRSGRGGARVGQAHDTGKPDDDGLDDPEATLAVDALVAGSTTDDLGQLSLETFGHVSRSSTPSIPPGFGPLLSSIPPALRDDVVTKPSSRIVPTSAPFTPSRGSSLVHRAATPLSQVAVPTTPKSVVSTAAETLTSKAKKEVKALASRTGLSKAIAKASAQPAIQSEEDFPALDSGKSKAVATPTPKFAKAVKTTTSSLTGRKVSTSGDIPPAQQATKADAKRAASGLNIAVPGQSSTKITTAIQQPLIKSAVASAFPPLSASTIASASVQSPIARTAPKTLRLTATPKAETPLGNVTPSSVTSMFPPNLPSRQPSLASISRLDRPGTPASEIISDMASITSASMSRPNSPPPSKVGSAPVRSTTKSMQRKHRKEMQKEKERSELVTVPEPEVEIAPIMGRKKKQKKGHIIHSDAGGSTPAASRPTSPGPAHTESAVEDPKPKVEPATQYLEQTSAEPEMSNPSSRGSENKGRGKAKLQPSESPEPSPPAPEVEEEVADRPLPTPATIFHDLLSSGAIGDVDSLYFLKPPVTNNRYQESTVDMGIKPKLSITAEDKAALASGLPVHKVAEGASRIMLTPNGDCVRNLSSDEEQRYLELQRRIAEEHGPTAFVSSKHYANNGFTLISGRAVPNGPPSFFPSVGSNAAMDPVSKIQRDEALSYINQYVLPSLSNNSQLEKALNANAFETEGSRNADASSWASWNDSGSQADDGDLSYGASNREGMIATGLESITAHFAVAGDMNRTQPLGNVALLSVEESEKAMQMARKETEGLEKKLHAMMRKNRRVLFASSAH